MDKKNLKCLVVLFLLLSGITQGKISDNGSWRKTDSVQKLIQESKDNEVKSRLFFQLATYYLKESTADSALHFFNRSYQLLNDTLSNEAEEILNEIGLHYYRQSDFTHALFYFQKALYIAKLKNDSASIARRYSNIAVIYDHLGDYVRSFAHNQEALKIFEQQNSKKGMAFIFNNLGVLSEEMENPGNALGYYRKALKLKLDLNDKSGAGSSLNNIGVVFEQYLPDYDSSLFYYRMAYEVFKEVGDQSGIATTLGNIGVIFWLKHQADSAVVYSEKALEIREKLNDIEGISSSLFNLGRAYSKMNNYQKAENYFKRSLDITKKINSRKRNSEIYEAMALLYSNKKEFNKAYAYHVKYSQLRDSILNEESNKQIAELKTIYEIEKKDHQLLNLSQKNDLQKESIAKYNFVLLSIFLIAALITFIAILLIRQNRQKVHQQTSALQQKLLRSQMNPHFIFNTLSSIQTYMLENDAKSASHFLSRFARLMRHILENSKHEFITLENEIEFLNNYLFIQKLRFNESFSYDVIFDEEEESSQINVPPMLSQPFVENAIDHGIRNIDCKGKIVVAFSIKENNLIITIEDNGLGFYHKKKQEATSKNHQSTGIENAKERITLLNNKYKTEHMFEIRDFSKENPSGNGTIITFAIPLIFA